MSAISFPTNQAEIFARTVEHHAEQLPPDIARFFLELELTADDQARLNELADKAREGSLTEIERQDLDEYRRAGRLVELMKLKARHALRSA